MITIKMEGFGSLRKLLAGGEKQVRFATAVALTRTAQDVRAELAKAMRAALSDASPYTLKAQYVESAKPANLQAKVGVNDRKPGRGTAPALLVREHFTGGSRGYKPMEMAMRAMKVLPDGYRVVPGPAMKLDRYGNPTKRAVSELLGALKRGVAVVGRRGKSTVTKGWFVAPVGGSPRTRHLAPGIWQRVNRESISPAFLFVKSASYRRRIDLPRMARSVAGKRFPAHFDAAFRQAMATAR
jgi:hypothetical protein